MIPILRPGDTVWRVEKADRAAVLVDGAAFYAAVRAACINARRRIIVVGWDIDSRTELVGAEPPTDGLPTCFADFLTAIVERNPELEVHLLLWDYSLVYAGERELMPRLSLQWKTPDRITLCLDGTVPFGSSQHQKLVVVDDALAFSGGLDITIRRWDTSDHRARNDRRVDPAGEPYRPFHDVQMMVDGAAARALAELARERWCRAQGGKPEIHAEGDPWPEGIEPDFRDVGIGIARTQPRTPRMPAVQEVERLFLASVDRAERFIYIENQFATSMSVARHLARRLRRNPHLEVVIVVPRSHDSALERRTMRNGRIRFHRAVERAGRDRVRMVYPAVDQPEGKTDTMVHSKIMVVDDHFLRVGSANLNNRSMGADTECDLAIDVPEVRSEADRATRARIVGLRDRLIGEHCGVSAERVAETLRETGSLVKTVDRLGANGHSLKPIEDGKPDRDMLSRLAERIADPGRPLKIGRLLGSTLFGFVSPHQRPAPPSAPSRSSAPIAIGVAAVLLIVLTFGWQSIGLNDLFDPEQIRQVLAVGPGAPWAVLPVVLAFVVAGAVAFPVTVLILATAAVFGPWLGMLYSTLGVAASALALYGVGRRFGRGALDHLLGKRWNELLDRLRARGLLAVVTLRVVPLAPFSVVNLAAGAASIRLLDYLLGTLIGMGPGLVAISLLGDRVRSLIANPTIEQIGWLVLCVLGWIALSFGAQAVVSRLGERPA